jgi:DHA2 family multidrug resistance protein
LEKERKERLSGGLKVDWVGFVLVAVFLGCLEIVLDKGQEDDWLQSSFIVSFAIVSAVSFAIFIPWEMARNDPIVDVRLLFQRQLGLALLVMMAIGAIIFRSTQLVPQLLQSNFGYTATTSGLVLMPGGMAMLLLMPISGRLANFVQPKYLMACGQVAVAIAMWHSTSLEQNAGFGFFARIRLYQMIGLPFLFVPINTVAYSELRPESTGQASSLINVARNLGGSIGISLENTELMQRAQFHQTRLVESAIPSSSSYQHALEHVTEFFVAQGFVADNRTAASRWMDRSDDPQSICPDFLHGCLLGLLNIRVAHVPLALTVRSVKQTTETVGHG